MILERLIGSRDQLAFSQESERRLSTLSHEMSSKLERSKGDREQFVEVLGNWSREVRKIEQELVEKLEDAPERMRKRAFSFTDGSFIYIAKALGSLGTSGEPKNNETESI